MPFRSHAGFTLIELSIVLVIIGLLIGGVLVGRDLIKGAAIRAQVSQIEKLNAAVHTFQTKYNGIPGDLPQTQAQAFGLYSPSNYVGCKGYGDGNGLIQSGQYCTIPWIDVIPPYGEILLFWRHLSDAKLIDGNYGAGMSDLYFIACVPCDDTDKNDINTYFPLAKIDPTTNIFVASPGNGNNYFLLTNITELDSWQTYSSNSITAQDAYAIDIKMDDGLPGSGNVFATSNIGDSIKWYVDWTTLSNVSTCVSAGAYALNPGTTKDCSLRFKFQ